MQIILYPHGGSANHGCEALVRASRKILSEYEIVLSSQNPDEDELYGLKNICRIINERNKINRYSLTYWIARLRFFFGDNDAFERVTYKKLLNAITSEGMALSFGGDNYCYGKPCYIYIMNRLLHKKNVPTILWGCSIEPDNIDDEMIADLKGYKHIFTRESITYCALIDNELSNVSLFPDPAFQLDRVDLPLPDGFIEGNTVGINVSPMIISYEKNKGQTLENYINMMQHIIDNSDMNIALIPHVVWADNDDRVPLHILYEHFKDTGRVLVIEDCNAEEMKGYIARCRFMVVARTHASIAAYSTCVPTLVVGYSVKAKGIAKDIFGTFENYVVPVQALSVGNELSTSFRWLQDNEKKIRNHLSDFMPGYCSRVLMMSDELNKLSSL